MLSSTYEALRNKAEARRAAERAVDQAKRALAHDPTNGNALGMAGYGLAVMGERERFKEWVDRALLINPDNMFMRYNFDTTQYLRFLTCGNRLHPALELQDVDDALDQLEPTISEYQSASICNATLSDPDLDILRKHPRFVRMMTDAAKKLNIEPPKEPAAI